MTPILVRPVPRGAADDLPRPVQDNDVGQVQEWLQRHELRRIGRDTVHQAVDLHAAENAFHPVQDYLNSLRWDRTERLSSWLHVYMGAEQNAYTAAIGLMFLIAMVARVFKPGCKADYVIILEGLQGALKSTMAAILGGRWFSDSLPDIGSDAVRLAQHLRGKWLIELSELSAMSRAEVEGIKAFITRCEEQFTPKYGRREVKEPRQCVFLGSTNKATYLKDETGGRRFWPVKVETLDTTGLARDRDQLFAEAVHLFRAGARWWPDAAFEAEYIRPQQAARYEADAWEQAISEWLGEGQVDVTVLKVARLALSIETPKLGTADQRRITAAMEQVGWMRNPVRGGHGERYWMKNSDAEGAGNV
jgi:predicted P-loop ATPase